MNLDPTWTQAWSSVIALIIAVGVPIYQQHKINQNKEEKIKTDNELKQQQIDMLKYNVRNYLIHSEYESSLKHADEINIFNGPDNFEKWLANGLLNNNDPEQRKILLFGQTCLASSINMDVEMYVEFLKGYLKDLNNL